MGLVDDEGATGVGGRGRGGRGGVETIVFFFFVVG